MFTRASVNCIQTLKISTSRITMFQKTPTYSFPAFQIWKSTIFKIQNSDCISCVESLKAYLAKWCLKRCFTSFHKWGVNQISQVAETLSFGWESSFCWVRLCRFFLFFNKNKYLTQGLRLHYFTSKQSFSLLWIWDWYLKAYLFFCMLNIFIFSPLFVPLRL